MRIYWPGVLWTLAIIVFVAGIATSITLAVQKSDRDYLHKCEARGGHVYALNSNNICIDSENRLILV